MFLSGFLFELYLPVDLLSLTFTISRATKEDTGISDLESERHECLSMTAHCFVDDCGVHCHPCYLTPINNPEMSSFLLTVIYNFHLTGFNYATLKK